MTITLKKLLFLLLLNGALFSMLIIGIQNSYKRNKVNFIFNETVNLPVGFIVGVAFISGSLTGSLLSLIYEKKKS